MSDIQIKVHSYTQQSSELCNGLLLVEEGNSAHFTKRQKFNQLFRFAIIFTHVSMYVWEILHEQEDDGGVSR